jgi:hypothetical protein
MASQFEIEQRIKDIAFDILNDVSRAEICRKMIENDGVSEATFERSYAKAQEYLRSKVSNKSAVERSIAALQQATPEAIATLQEALKAKGEDELPSAIAINAAGKILGKGIPDEVRFISVNDDAKKALNEIFGDEEKTAKDS